MVYMTWYGIYGMYLHDMVWHSMKYLTWNVTWCGMLFSCVIIWYGTMQYGMVYCCIDIEPIMLQKIMWYKRECDMVSFDLRTYV